MLRLAGPSKIFLLIKMLIIFFKGIIKKNFGIFKFVVKSFFCMIAMLFGGNFRVLFAEQTKAEKNPSVSQESNSEGTKSTPELPIGAKFEKSREELDLEKHEAKARKGGRISPPTALEKEKRNTKSVEQLFRALSEESGLDGEVSVPLDEETLELVDPEEAERRRLYQRRRDSEIRRLDTELSGGRKSMGEKHNSELNEIEKELGVERLAPDEGNLPSFTLALKKIRKLFKQREYEEALLELSAILKHYPESAQLLLMKGSVHQRMGQIDLALAAYEASYELEPSRRLKYQIDFLKRKIAERESLRRRQEGIVTPLGISDITYGEAIKPSPQAFPATKITPPQVSSPGSDNLKKSLPLKSDNTNRSPAKKGAKND